MKIIKPPLKLIKNLKNLNNSTEELNKLPTSPSFSDILSIPSNPEDFFILSSFIGKGAFGSVYKGVHKLTKKEYAIKIISYNFSLNQCPKYENIQQEISLMKLCESPYIIKYYGSYYSRNSNSLWLILEYCQGGSIIDLMSAMGRTLQEIELASIIEMLLKGLKEIHALNLIHRDIKGANILIDENGNAKLGDFGVGVQLTEKNKFRYSKKGSPYWMSPQVCSNNFYDTKTDIWSLGITCIELMEGDPPYNNIKPNMVMKLIVNEPPTGKKLFDKKRIEEFNYSKEFVDFVGLCLQVDPSKRPCAKELLEHEFIKKYSKGKKIIKELIEKYIDDIEKIRIEEERKERLNNINNKNIVNENNIIDDIYSEKNEDIRIFTIDDNIVSKGKVNDNDCEDSITENDDIYSNNSMNVKNTQSENDSYNYSKSIINKESIKTINSNNNENDSNKQKKTPEFMKYVLNNEFIFNEDDYIAIETKNMIDNINGEKKEDKKDDIDEITNKINQLEMEKEKELNEFEKKINKYKKIQKIMNQYNLKSIKEYEVFIKNQSIISSNFNLSTEYKSNKETLKDDLNIEQDIIRDSMDDKGIDFGVRNNIKVMKVQGFSNYFS